MALRCSTFGRLNQSAGTHEADGSTHAILFADAGTEFYLWIARTGAQWRHLPDAYGKWNSVFRRYRRWVETGVFDALLETLAEMVERDAAADMIDSTIIRAHHCAVGIKGGLSRRKRLVARAAASPPNCMPAATPEVARSASS